MNIKSTALLTAVGAAGVALDARFRQPYQPVLERVEIPIPSDHASLAGLRIGFITDTHLGPFVSARDLEQATAKLAAAEPDLLLLGGDYVSESPRFAGVAASILGTLAAAAPLGGIAVLGNHDLSTSQTKVTAALERAGIEVLRNQSATVHAHGARLWIAGIDETILGEADVDAAYADIPDKAAVIALWHEPDYASETARRGAIVQLSGHSHGGQVCLPLLGPIVLPPGGRIHPRGLSWVGGMPIYTSRGAGVYRPPVRLNCPPEVTLITLGVE